MIEKVISGGQTGVDRAALDVAIRLGIPTGGRCPKGRWAEDGAIPDDYLLAETDSYDLASRTTLNLQESDGTLVITPGVVSPGTSLTIDEANRHGISLIVCNPVDPEAVQAAYMWTVRENIKILNVAGPRASEHSGIYGFAARFLLRFLSLATSEQSD